MLPKTISGERAHREYKRRLEIDMIIRELAFNIRNDLMLNNKDINILEFGSGDGFQIPYLQRLGRVIASDIYISDGIKEAQEIEFAECKINRAPFKKGQFDLIFSNHVIEHIEDLENVFYEIKRIGSGRCIYAFSVPTNTWLLLSIPGYYYKKFRNIFGKPENRPPNGGNTFLVDPPQKRSMLTRLTQALIPRGHGIKTNFIECYQYFKIENWCKLFSEHGFSVIETKPLLLYGPSEWPIIPTLNSTNRLCSSVLFLMKKNP